MTEPQSPYMCQLVPYFAFHLKLELLTQFPPLNEKQNLAYLVFLRQYE